MKWLKLPTVMLFTFMSLQTHAFLLVDIQKDVAVDESTSIWADLSTHGFNSLTDRIIRVDLFLYFREVNDDSLIDRAGDETAEFVGFSKVLFGERYNWDADIDTGLYTFNTSFSPTDEDTCLLWDEFYECIYDPVNSGILFIGLQTMPDTLWLDEVRWEVEVLRSEVNESTPSILFVVGLCALNLVRRLRY